MSKQRHSSVYTEKLEQKHKKLKIVKELIFTVKMKFERGNATSIAIYAPEKVRNKNP